MSIAFPSTAGDFTFSGDSPSPEIAGKPANTANGDLLIAVTSGRDSPFSAIPSGWTTLIPSFTTSGSVGQAAVHYLAVPDASVLPASWSWSFIETRSSVLIFRVTGVDLTSPFPASGGTATAFNATDATTIAVPSVVSGGAGFLVGFTYFQEYDLAVPVAPWNTWGVPWNKGITGSDRQQIVVAAGADGGAGSTPAFTLSLVTQWPLNNSADQAAIAVVGLNAVTGAPSFSGSGTANVALGATATGAKRVAASVTASIGVGASATGTHHGTVAGAASVTFGASAAGSHHGSRSVTATLGLSAVATGAKRVAKAVSAAIGFLASATGAVGPEGGQTVLCQRIDSGSMAGVQIPKSLISDRYAVGPVPDYIPCLQVMDDALEPGRYLLVGYLYVAPYFEPLPGN